MTNWYSIFYWLTVADNVKNLFDALSDIFTFFAFVLFIIFIIARIGEIGSVMSNTHQSEKERKGFELAKSHSLKLFYPALALCLVTWILFVFTPSKKDCVLIAAGGAVGNFIQSDSSASAIPSDITKFLHLSLRKEISELSKEERESMALSDSVPSSLIPQNSFFLDKMKEMTKDEIIKYLESDSLKEWNKK